MAVFGSKLKEQTLLVLHRFCICSAFVFLFVYMYVFLICLCFVSLHVFPYAAVHFPLSATVVMICQNRGYRIKTLL